MPVRRRNRGRKKATAIIVFSGGATKFLKRKESHCRQSPSQITAGAEKDQRTKQNPGVRFLLQLQSNREAKNKGKSLTSKKGSEQHMLGNQRF